MEPRVGRIVNGAIVLEEQTIPELDVHARPRVTVTPPHLFPLTLSRLIDHELVELAPRLHRINIDNRHRLDLGLSQPDRFLPKVFLGAQLTVGRTSQIYDPDKCSFRFPLLLSGMRHDKPLRYVVVVQDVCAFVRVQMSRIGSLWPSEKPNPGIAPVEEELGPKELSAIGHTILRFFEKTGAAAAASTPCFYREVPDSLLVYGCRRGEFFEREVKDQDAYQQLLATIEADLGAAHLREEQRVTAMVEAIANSSP